MAMLDSSQQDSFAGQDAKFVIDGRSKARYVSERQHNASSQANQSADNRKPPSGGLAGASILSSSGQPSIFSGNANAAPTAKPGPLVTTNSQYMRQFMPKNTLPLSKYHNKILIPQYAQSATNGTLQSNNGIQGQPTPNFQNITDNYQVGMGGLSSQASLANPRGANWQKSRHQQFRIAMNNTQIMPDNNGRMLNMANNSNDCLTQPAQPTSPKFVQGAAHKMNLQDASKMPQTSPYLQP